MLTNADQDQSNLAIGAVIFLLITFGLRFKVAKNPIAVLPRLEKLKHLDPLGGVVILGAVTCLFLALQWCGTKYPWNSSKIIGLLVGSGLLFVPFGFLQWWLGELATLLLRVLRQHTVFCGAASLFFISMSSNTVGLPVSYFLYVVAS